MRLIRALLALLLATLAGCASVVPLPRAETAPSAQAAQDAWARVLLRFVNDEGEVDFARLATDRADLDRVLAYIAATPFEQLPAGAPRLAHHINSYNALSMFNVIASGLPETHAGLAKLRFFVLRRFNIGGRELSLYAYENEVIRPLGDPRVHFALNCSARSCPVLPRVPFRADALDKQLDFETRAFFARPENLRVDPAARTVWLSEIMSFYSEDFAPAAAPSLLDYVRRYTTQVLPADYAVRFTPYDWSVAHVRPRTEPHLPTLGR